MGRAVHEAGEDSPAAQAQRKRRARPDGPSPGVEPADPADPEAVARQICLQQLTAAPRTRAQLASVLHRRGVPAEVAEAMLERFADVQLIDDAMFARAWVESRHRGRGLARRALAAELRQRGVEAEDIRAAVDRLDPEQEYATAPLAYRVVREALDDETPGLGSADLLGPEPDAEPAQW